MAVDVSVAIGTKTWPRSTTVAYGEACGTSGVADRDWCGSAVYLHGAGAKAGFKRSRTTIAVMAGNAPLLVSFRTAKNATTGRTRVVPGSPRTFTMPMSWVGTEVHIYPDGVPLGGSAVTIVSPIFLK